MNVSNYADPIKTCVCLTALGLTQRSVCLCALIKNKRWREKQLHCDWRADVTLSLQYLLVGKAWSGKMLYISHTQRCRVTVLRAGINKNRWQDVHKAGLDSGPLTKDICFSKLFWCCRFYLNNWSLCRSGCMFSKQMSTVYHEIIEAGKELILSLLGALFYCVVNSQWREQKW